MSDINSMEITLSPTVEGNPNIRLTVIINSSDMYMFRVSAHYNNYDELVDKIILSNKNTMKSLVGCYQEDDIQNMSESSFMCLAYGYANAIASGIHHELESLNARPVELASHTEMEIIGIRLVGAEEDQSRFAMDVVIIEDDMPCDELTLYCDYDGSDEVRFSDLSKDKIDNLSAGYGRHTRTDEGATILKESMMEGYDLESILKRKAAIEISDFIFNF